MNSQEFVIWLKGFTEGVHDFNVTPKQWDLLKEKLAEVNDTIPMGGILSDHNTFRTVYPNYTGINPYGTTLGPNTGTRVTTTPGTTGTIIVNNPLVTTGFIQPTDVTFPTPDSYTLTSGSSSIGTVTYNPVFPGTTVSYTVTTGSSIGVGATYTIPFDVTATSINSQSGSWHYTTSNDKTLLHD